RHFVGAERGAAEKALGHQPLDHVGVIEPRRFNEIHSGNVLVQLECRPKRVDLPVVPGLSEAGDYAKGVFARQSEAYGDLNWPCWIPGISRPAATPQQRIEIRISGAGSGNAVIYMGHLPPSPPHQPARPVCHFEHSAEMSFEIEWSARRSVPVVPIAAIHGLERSKFMSSRTHCTVGLGVWYADQA